MKPHLRLPLIVLLLLVPLCLPSKSFPMPLCIILSDPAPSDIVDVLETLEESAQLGLDSVPLCPSIDVFIYGHQHQGQFSAFPTQASPTPGFQGGNIYFESHWGTPAANVYDALTNKCQKHSIAIVLQRGESLTKTTISKVLYVFGSDSSIYMMETGIKIKGTTHHPNSSLQNFHRYKYINKQQRYAIYANVSAHLRVFKIDFYRDLMFYDHVDLNGQFYQSKNGFLFPMLEMRVSCPQCQTKKNGFMQQYGSFMPITVFLTNEVLFECSKINNVFDQQAQQLFQRRSYEPLSSKFTQMRRKKNGNPEIWGQDIQPGQYNLLSHRNISTKSRIPKKVHQTWISSQPLPPLKKKLTEIVQKVYQGWQYKLWTKQDISEKNFPATFKYLKKLLQLEKKWAYLRSSMIADLMKIQILYRYGGVYIDINYEPFKTLQKFRNYPLILGVEKTYLAPKAFSVGYLASQPHQRHLAALLDQRKLQKINLKGWANIETGPYYIGSVFKPEDLLDVKILYSSVYVPYAPWLQKIDPRFSTMPCRSDQNPSEKRNKNVGNPVFVDKKTNLQKISSTLSVYKRKKSQKYLQSHEVNDLEIDNEMETSYFSEKGQYTTLPCKGYKQFTLGVDHFYVGATWVHKKQGF